MRYKFPEDLKRAYESSPLSFVYYQNIAGKGVPVLASEGFCKNTGMDRSRVLTWLETGVFERMHPDDVGLVSKVSEEFLHQREPYDVVFRCRIGEAYEIFHGVGKWQTMPDGTELAVIAYANLRNTQERMASFSEKYKLFQTDRFYTDPLTGLPNTNYLHEYANEKLNVIRAEGSIPVLIYSDVNAMQSYNNQYGFDQGDKLLCLIATILKESFPNALIIRGADDHFVILSDMESRKSLAAQLDAVDNSIKRNAQGNTAGISSGIYVFQDKATIEEGLDHAKHALKRMETDMTQIYRFFSQEADDRYWKNRYIIENFDRALENGWIRVFYQGIVRLDTRKIAAFEALARWMDPVRGTISPADFIPVLQKYHLLYKLDLYMLEQVCREVIIRHENDLPLVPVSVNFARQDFDHADVVGTMNALYEKYEMAKYVSKDYFIVEITEQDVAIGAERFQNQLKRIRENGYQLWLDDFGSGYSSINMFSQLRFDLIKYDMDLLRHLDDNGGPNRLILKELVFVAKKLGMHTLTEGLENEDQFEFLREIGCELAQGFYFYKPEPIDEILFRIRCGDPIKPCETKEDRRLHGQKWLADERTAQTESR